MKGQDLPAADQKPDLRAEQYKLVRLNIKIAILAGISNSVITALVFWKQVSRFELVYWLAIVLIFDLLRLFFYSYPDPESNDTEAAQKIRRLQAEVFLSGVIWGLSVFLVFPGEHFFHQIYLTLLLGGMIMGAMIVYAALYNLVLLYSSPVIIPLIIMHLAQANELSVSIGLLTLLFFISISIAAWHMHMVTTTGLKLRFENLSLIQYLQDSRLQTEAINQKLKEEIISHQVTETELKKNQENLAIAQQIARLGSFDWNLETEKMIWSQELYRITKTSETILQPDYHDFLLCLEPDSRPVFAHAIKKAIYSAEDLSLETTLLLPDHNLRHVQIHGEVFRNQQGQACRLIATVHDITEQKFLHENLLLSRTVFDNISEAILVTDTRAKILAVNPAFCRLTGYQTQDVIGKNPSMLSSGQQSRSFYQNMWQQLLENGSWQGEILNRRKTGEVYTEWLSIASVTDENQARQYVAIFSDISERKKYEDLIQHRANHDALTDLPNRHFFYESLEKSLQKARAGQYMLAVMFLDLDGFKQINDNLGHDIGDLVLQETGKQIKNLLGNQGLVARLGGDEFIIMLERLNSKSDASSLAGKILAEINQPKTIKNHQIHVGASMGISFFPEHGSNAESLIRNADNSMYVVKAAGKNSYSVFSS